MTRQERAQSKRQLLSDYLTCTIADPNSKWVTDFMVRDRRVCVRGISLAISQEGKKCQLDPVIPCMGPLIRLLQKNPKLVDVTFDAKKRKWRPS